MIDAITGFLIARPLPRRKPHQEARSGGYLEFLLHRTWDRSSASASGERRCFVVGLEAVVVNVGGFSWGLWGELARGSLIRESSTTGCQSGRLGRPAKPVFVGSNPTLVFTNPARVGVSPGGRALGRRQDSKSSSARFDTWAPRSGFCTCQDNSVGRCADVGGSGRAVNPRARESSIGSNPITSTPNPQIYGSGAVGGSAS